MSWRKPPEPCGKSRSCCPTDCEVGFGVAGVNFRRCSRPPNYRPPRNRASDVEGPLSEALISRLISARDCESGTVDLSAVQFHNISVDYPDFVLLVDEVESGIGNKVVGSHSWISEVVRLEYYHPIHEAYIHKKNRFENVQLCTTLIESPGAMTLYSPSSAAISGEYLTNTPENEGFPPFA